jgi:hypothetical protein
MSQGKSDVRSVRLPRAGPFPSSFQAIGPFLKWQMTLLEIVLSPDYSFFGSDVILTTSQFTWETKAMRNPVDYDLDDLIDEEILLKNVSDRELELAAFDGNPTDAAATTGGQTYCWSKCGTNKHGC